MKSIRMILKENVELRHIKPEDAQPMFDMIDSQREYLGEWLPFVFYTDSMEDCAEYIGSVTDSTDSLGECVFTILVDGKFAGIIGFKESDYINKKTEIGYWIGEQYQGRGIVTRATELLCWIAFNKMDMNRIQIKCALGNFRSSNVPVRLGFVFERVERDGEMFADGSFQDLEIYSLLRKEYATWYQEDKAEIQKDRKASHAYRKQREYARPSIKQATNF